MTKSIVLVTLVVNAQIAAEFWESHPEIKLNEITGPQFKKLHAAFSTLVDECTRKESELRELLTQREKLAAEVKSLTRRFRTTVSGIYGADSAEFEKLGGKRTGLHKSRKTRRETAAGEIPPPVSNGVRNTVPVAMS
ncbi:MAG TPA: hypothetical protein VEH04_01720 [Verrucomicrobiae bacterium]|nr:hypothetical protein [Verrucomicrobiae bacterium]